MQRQTYVNAQLYSLNSSNILVLLVQIERHSMLSIEKLLCGQTTSGTDQLILIGLPLPSNVVSLRVLARTIFRLQ